MVKNLPGKTSYWWILLFEGVLQLILGLLLLFSTDVTILVLVEILGIYWLIRGIIMIFQIFIGNGKNWGWTLLGGLLGILAGIVVLRYPLFSTFIVLEFLVILIALVGLVQGTISIVNGLRGEGFWQVLLGAVIWIICLFLLFNPLGSAAALPLVIGIFWVVDGIALTIMSFYLRR